jgi:hypothetical protein
MADKRHDLSLHLADAAKRIAAKDGSIRGGAREQHAAFAQAPPDGAYVAESRPLARRHPFIQRDESNHRCGGHLEARIEQRFRRDDENSEDQGKRQPRVRHLVEREIGDDAAGKQHGQPEEPAVLLSLERCRGKRRGREARAPCAERPVAAPFLFATSPHPATSELGSASPALTRIRPLCYITRMPAVARRRDRGRVSLLRRMKLRFTPHAVQDLAELAAYLHALNPKAARHVRAAIYENLKNLFCFHGSGDARRQEEFARL